MCQLILKLSIGKYTMEKERYVCCIFVLISSLQLIFGCEKHWLPNFEWQTGSNWVDGRPPELDSRIEFPLETRHAVDFPRGNFRFSGINLSRDGILVLGKNGILEISEFQKTSKKVAKWLKEGLFFWADPENWNTTFEAVPHVDRVPCSSDIVTLPDANHTLNIRLPMTDIQVKSVKLGNSEVLSSTEWWILRHKREFSGQRYTVRYSDILSCEGCPCQENLDAYLEEICDIQRVRCGTLSCQEPIQVEGHCCDFCGGRVTLSAKSFLPKVKRLTNQALNTYENTLTWYVRKVKEGAIEVLVTERGTYTGIRSQEAVDNLKAYFEEEGILIQSAQFTGYPYKDFRLIVTLGPLFGSLLVAVIFLVALFLYFGYSYTQILEGWNEFWYSVQSDFRENKETGKSFNFARFENDSEGNVQLASPSTTQENENNNMEQANNDQSSFGERFENPLYRSKKGVKKNKREDCGVMDINAPLSLTELQNVERDEITEETEVSVKET